MSKLTITRILLFSTLTQILMWSNGHNWGGDFAQYIMQAISLSKGAMQEFVETNSFTLSGKGHVTYPWGFPILLAPIYAIFGFNITAFKALVLVFFLAFLIVLWFFFKDQLTIKDRKIYVALFAFNPYLLYFGDNVLSDIPFLFFSTFAFLIFSRLPKANSRFRLYLLSIALGFCFAAATAIRTNGVLLPLTYAITLLIFLYESHSKFRPIPKNSWLSISEKNSTHRSCIFLLPLITFSLPLLVLINLVPDHQASHVSGFAALSVKSVFINIGYYGLLLKDFFGWFPLSLIIYLLSVPPLLMGLKKEWRESTPILIYVALTLGLYVLWPHHQGLRFIFPLLPFYIYYIFVGMTSCAAALAHVKATKHGILIAVLLLFALQISALIYLNLSRNRTLDDGPFTKQATEMFAYIRHNIPSNEVVVFRKPRVMRLFTDRNSISFENIDDFKYRQWYVVDKKNLSPVDLINEELFKSYSASLYFENSQFQVYKFK